ncbi:MAG: hypothetical protein WCR28_03715 [Candidatus Izemoplasmatales bacterium]|jgi:hypothetical protein|nr:hypothetical protein [Candidatus Izemoplasmatales bacterium]MDD4988104.1 hypothetical protein [Candidatus Izemoplasmatales bacterium]MDY0372645.1 hypothetical protein [Candidatus Izemoplasmatales bacterium]
MKKILLILLFTVIVLGGCAEKTTTDNQSTTTPITSLNSTTAIEESPCKDTPLADGCYIPMDDINFEEFVREEYTINETFETDMIGQIPRNWLLYMNAEYKPQGVMATVVEEEDNRFVEMYSDGRQRPMYPQNAPTPTFIFSTKFNLDIQRKGVCYLDLMVPEENKNAVSAGISTGAVNTISITINNDYSVFVKVGGPFYYYSSNSDGGVYYETSVSVAPGVWSSFKLTWDADLNLVNAYVIEGDSETLLVSVPFHVSNRFNAKSNGTILVPNVVKVTMPYGQSGYAYIDNVVIEEADS